MIAETRCLPSFAEQASLAATLRIVDHHCLAAGGNRAVERTSVELFSV
jgi:hypothetical protein